MLSLTQHLKKVRLLIVLVCTIGLSSNAFGACIPPATPSAFSASVTAVTSPTAQLTLTWTATGADDVRIQISTDATFTAAGIVYDPGDQANDGTQVISGFTCGSTYWLRIYGHETSSGGCYSSPNTITAYTVVCATCTDGIMNGTETGVDCGGSCTPCAAASCTDGIKNGTETGIDCGGTCPPCVLSCNDGIQNGMETGIDCGGGCPLTCTTNTTSVPGTAGCAGTEIATIYSTNCDQVGTSAYNINSPAVQMVSSTTFTAPPAGITCGSPTGNGRWAHLELDNDVNSVLVMFDGGSMGTGSSITYVAAFNTNSACPAAGDYVGCGAVTEFSSGSYYAYNQRFNNLDPNKDLWLFFYNSSKTFSLTYELVGISNAEMPTNQTCATATNALGEGCNLGALGATWTAPEATGVDRCGGGAWTSNENTVYYSFTADATSASLEVEAISCNEGTTGAAQFGVWTSCAAIGTYAGGFLGCQVGTAPLSLSPLIDGQTYYIAVDGTAGDNCTWGFTGTGIVMPIEYAALSAFHDGENVTVNWSTSSEKNNDFFTIQRTIDGRSYENIGMVPGAGNSSVKLDYSFVDSKPYPGTSYYRVKQTDFDGKYKYSDIRPVSARTESLKLVPNPADVEVKISLDLNLPQRISISIFDINGFVVFHEDVEGKKGSNNMPVDISVFSKGIYSVQVITGSQVLTEKLSVY